MRAESSLHLERQQPCSFTAPRDGSCGCLGAEMYNLATWKVAAVQLCRINRIQFIKCMLWIHALHSLQLQIFCSHIWVKYPTEKLPKLCFQEERAHWFVFSLPYFSVSCDSQRCFTMWWVTAMHTAGVACLRKLKKTHVKTMLYTCSHSLSD